DPIYVLVLRPPPPPSSTPFPYTTLFRSFDWTVDGVTHRVNLIDTPGHDDFVAAATSALDVVDLAVLVVSATDGVEPGTERAWARSEEHTSELQSRENLVCRLLLEKKK